MASRERHTIPELDEPELVDTGVETDRPADDPEIDQLTREDVEEDPGEATRSLPKNDQAL